MAISLNGTTGITTPGITNTGAETVVDLTTTGNTILGDASGDTLTVTGGTTTFTQGTANGVAFLNGSKVLTTGSANLTFNGTTLTANTIGAFTLGGTIAGGGNQINNVVIGTTTPLAGNFTTLSATGVGSTGGFTSTASGSAASPSIEVYGGGEMGFFRAAANQLGVAAGGAVRGVFSTTGLAVTGTLSATGTLSGGTSGTAYSFSGSAPAGSLTLGSGGALAISGVSGTGYQGLRLFGTGTAYNYMQIDNTGGTADFGIENSSGGALISGSSAYATVIQSYSNTAIHFGTNNTLRMTLDTSGNLGINTASPGQKLDVNGVIRCRDGAIILSIGTATKGVFLPYSSLTGSGTDYTPTIQSETGLGIAFAVNGSVTKSMTLADSGNLGIGTTSPSQKLEVSNGAAQFNGGGIDGNFGDAILFGNTSFPAVQKNRIRSSISAGAGNLLSIETSTGTTGAYNSNQLVLKGDGNVGIGTTAPQNKLQVKDTVRPQLSVSYDGTTGLYLEDSSNSFGKSWKIATSTAVNSQLEFYQSTSANGVPTWATPAAVVFDASGNLLVRTAGKSTITGLDTTAYAAGVGGTLDLGGNYRATGDFQGFVRIAAEKTNGTNTDYGYNMGFYVTTNNGATLGTKAATIISDGTLLVGTTTGSASDGKLQVAATGTGAGAANTKLGFALVEFDSVNGAGLWLGSMTNENTGVIGSRTSTGNIAFQTYNGGWAERMRLTYDGNLGIGSNSPGAKLQIDSGDIRLQGNAPGKILFFSTGNGVSQNATLEVQNDGGTTNTGEFRFSTRNVATTLAERVRITAEGNLGIGTSSPNARLDVRGDTGSSVSAIMRIRGTNATSRTTRLQFEDYSGGIADGTIDFKIPTAADASSAVLQMGVNGSAALAIDVNSNVQIYGTIGFGEKAALKSNFVTNITSGSAQTIFTMSVSGNMGAYVMVRGVDSGGNWFVDFLSFLSSNTITLLAGMNGGAPGSRTYAVATNTLTLNPSVTQTSITVSANQIGS